MASEYTTVRDAAKLLQVSPDAIRKLLASGALSGAKVGRDWLIDSEALERRRRSRPGGGRPLSAATSWGVILERSASLPNGVPSQWEDGARRRGRRWLARHELPAEAVRLGSRATPERFDAHPSELPRLLQREHFLRTGLAAAASVGLLGVEANRVELYAPAVVRDDLMRKHGLLAGDGRVLIRWIDDELWDVICGFTAPGAAIQTSLPLAPRTAILLDLLESDDPRARRIAADALTR